MDLVHRDAIGRAHSAGVELAAMAVVVAHLDRLVEAAPLIPTQRGLGYAGRIAGLSWDEWGDRKSTRLNSSHTVISYAVFCLKKKKKLPSACQRKPTTYR